MLNDKILNKYCYLKIYFKPTAEKPGASTNDVISDSL